MSSVWPCERRRAARLGITKIDTTSETDTASAMATATSRRSSPTSPCQSTIGMKTATVVAVDAMSAPQTSRMPRYAASFVLGARVRQVSMLSSATIELSTTMPMANVMPASETTLIVRPKACMPSAVANAHTGMATLTTAEAPNVRRNRNNTTIASAAPSRRFCCTRSSAPSMYST